MEKSYTCSRRVQDQAFLLKAIDLLEPSYELPYSDGNGRLGGIINVLFLPAVVC